MTLLAAPTSFVIGNAFQAQMPEFAADLGHGDADVYYSMCFAAECGGSARGCMILESRGVRHAEPAHRLMLVILWCL